jgi:hypothetical protein
MREKGPFDEAHFRLGFAPDKTLFTGCVRGVYGAGDQQPDLVIGDADVEPIMGRRTDASKVRRTF